MIQGEHLVTLTSDKLKIKIAQFPWSTGRPDVTFSPLFSVSHSPGNRADFCESMEICTLHLFTGLKSVRGLYLCRSFLSGNEWTRRLKNNQEDGRIEAYFPWCIFLSVIKRQMISEKQFDYVLWLWSGSICTILGKFQCFDLFSSIRSGGPDGSFGILITYCDKYVFSWHTIWAYTIAKNKNTFCLVFFPSFFSTALSGLTAK